MTSKRYHILLFAVLLLLLSVGLGIDRTFARINHGLAVSSEQETAEKVYVVWKNSEPQLTTKVDQGRYFLGPDEIEQVNRNLPVSVTLLEYKDSRTVTLLRLERWNADGLLSEVYEGHQSVAVPVRTSFLPASYLRAAVWAGVRYALFLFFGAGSLLGILFYFGGAKRARIRKEENHG